MLSMNYSSLVNRQGAQRPRQKQAGHRCKRHHLRIYAAVQTSLPPCKGQLRGAPIVKLDEGHHIIPLITPQRDNIPLAMALEIYHPSSRNSINERRLQQLNDSYINIYQMRYVLQGDVEVTVAGNDQVAQILAGDTIITKTPIAVHQPADQESHIHTNGRANGSFKGLKIQPANQNDDKVSDGHGMHHHLMQAHTHAHQLFDETKHSAVELLQGLVKSFKDSFNHDLNILPNEQVLVSLLFLLPDKPEDFFEGDLSTVTKQVSQAANEWVDNPKVGQVTPEMLDQLLACASRCAKLAFNDVKLQAKPIQIGGLTTLPPLQSPSPSQVHSNSKDQARIVQDSDYDQSSSVNHAAQTPLPDTLFRPQINDQETDDTHTFMLHHPLTSVHTYQLPNQTNRLVLLVDPFSVACPFVFGVEIFEPGHVTPLHTHPHAYELFFMLSGTGIAHCDGEQWEVEQGDVAVFPAGSEHGIDVHDEGKMYCAELMLPNEMFAEFVKGGNLLEGLSADDLCVLADVGCGAGGGKHTVQTERHEDV